MTDIFSHKITNKQGGQPNPYKRKNKKQQTSAIYLQTLGQKLVGIMDGIFQEYPGQSGDNTYQKTQDDDKIPFFDMAYRQLKKLTYQLFHHDIIQVLIPIQIACISDYFFRILFKDPNCG